MMLDGAAPKNVQDAASQALIALILKRHERAERDFNRHSSRIQACYKYALPWRHGVNASEPVDQLDDIYDDILMSVLEDFAADMGNVFTPQKSDWLETGPVIGLPSDISAMVAKQTAANQRIVFSSMLRSNLYQALQESYLDLGVGTMALTVDILHLHMPLHCQAVPMTELRIDRGPYGFVDGRWRKRRMRCEDIRVLWPEAMPPDGQQWSAPETEHEVIDGVWRMWGDRREEVYQYAVVCDSKLIFSSMYQGIGSCPMIVARWSRDSTTAYGVGPTYKSMPSYQSANHVRYLLLKKLGEVTDPSFSYEDDGVANFENGLTPGTAFPRAKGSDAPEVIESGGRFDVTWMQADELTSSIKRQHYQDRPEQRGKTPPSASQWMDESAERQRRMNTPATNLVQELQIELYKRFMFLEMARGNIEPMQVLDLRTGQPIEVHPLDPRYVTITPTSPLLRAQEQEELLRIVRTAEIASQLWGPQIAAVVNNPFKIQEEVGRIMKTSQVVRDEKEAEAAIKVLLPALQAGSGGAGQAINPEQLLGGGPNG
jgi:hypothetical protein